MNHNEERAIADFRRALLSLYLLRHALAALTVWAFAYGTAVLALRRLPPAGAVRAVLDQHGRCGGLLMAGAEFPLGGWSAALPAVRAPRLRWHGGKAWGLFAAGCAFVALGFVVPQSLASMGGS